MLRLYHGGYFVGDINPRKRKLRGLDFTTWSTNRWWKHDDHPRKPLSGRRRSLKGKQQRQEECQEVGRDDGQGQGMGHEECQADGGGQDDRDWSQKTQGMTISGTYNGGQNPGI